MAALYSPQQFASSRSPASSPRHLRYLLFTPLSRATTPISNNASTSGSTKRSSQSSFLFSGHEEEAAGEAMADLNDAAQFALCVALGISYILKPLLDFLDAVKPLSPVLEAAVAVLIPTLPLAYLMGILLLQLQVAPAPAPAPVVPLAPGAARRFACFACTMVSAVLAVLAVVLIAFWLLTGGSPQ